MSLPKEMLEDMRKFAKENGYISMSELVRDVLRKYLAGELHKH